MSGDISSDCVCLPNRQLWINGNVHFDVQASRPDRDGVGG